MVQGLTITRLPAPLLLTDANCRRWGDQQIERQPLSAGELRTDLVMPSAEVITRLPRPLLLTARTVLGLGTPPLYQADLLIEYSLKPSQQLRRFGNRIEVNQFSTRSSALPSNGGC
jgi:hypothetical protein